MFSWISKSISNIQYIMIFLSAQFLQGHRPDWLRAKNPIGVLENVVKSLCFINTEWTAEFVVVCRFEVDFYLKHSKSSFDQNSGNWKVKFCEVIDWFKFVIPQKSCFSVTVTALQQAIKDIILYLAHDKRFPYWFGQVTDIFIFKGKIVVSAQIQDIIGPIILRTIF